MSTRITSMLLRLFFAAAYTFVVMIFTANFFTTIAIPPSVNLRFANAFSLVDAHTFMLPFFLGALEFASVSLACSFWTRTRLSQRMLIVLVFLACQTLPFTSVYFEIRSRNYRMEKEKHADLITKNTDVRQASIQTFKESIQSQETPRLNAELNIINQVTSEIQSKRNELNSIGNAIVALNSTLVKALPTEQDTIASVRQEKRAERSKINDRIKVLEQDKVARQKDILTLESELSGLRGQLQSKSESHSRLIAGLRDTLKNYNDELRSFVLNQSSAFNYSSEFEYILKNMGAPKSIFATIISLVFPISVLAIGFVLPKALPRDEYALPAFQLKPYLDHATQLPEDAHYGYSKLLVPSLVSYVLALKASKRIANENVILHLRDDVIARVIAQLRSLEREILLSKLEENAKNFLLNEIQKLMKKQLITEEDAAYAHN